MERSNIVDAVFWCVIFLSITALIGLYRCISWKAFLEWLTFIGLILVAMGSLALALAEYRPIQRYMWPSLNVALQKLCEDLNEYSGHDAFFEQGDDGFEKLEEIAKDHRTISHSYEEEEEVNIQEFRLWPGGNIYAFGTNRNQATIGSPSLVKKWIQEKASELTRRKIRPYAMVLLFIGFTMQLMSHIF